MSEMMLAVEQTRNVGTIGASKAAAALGLNRYESPLSLWRQLRGLADEETKPAFVQEAALFGQLLEPVVRGLYAVRKPAAVHVPTESTVMDGWLHATCDGLVYLNREPGTYEGELNVAPDGLLEVKTASAYKADEWEDAVPVEYEIQARCQMAVMGAPWTDVVCLVGGQQLRGPFRVMRDPELEANILRDLRAFHELVQSGREPDVDGSQAWREYASSKMRPSKVELVADAEANALVANWLTAKRQIKALKEIEALHKTSILLKLSAAGATRLRSTHGDVSAYQVGARTDWKSYAISLGGAAKPPAQFKGAPGAWTVKAPKDDDDGE